MLNLDLASRRYHTDANLERLFRFDLEKLHELEDNLGIPEVVMVGKSDGTTFKLDGTPKRPWGGKSVTNTVLYGICAVLYGMCAVLCGICAVLYGVCAVL
jgi:hypothetical protein